jgi:phosphoribosyl-AMP cyclohydrolase / phosphoribosyl-ATP pyrophosphohydrolase
MRAPKVRPFEPSAVRFGPDGLVAAVVQDADDGRVLMVAWQDAEAIAATLATGEAHFHSRSRDALWKKGETSGNTLAVVSMELDCDGDAVLITARPAGPTCHTDARSCFDLEPGAEAPAGSIAQRQDFAWLERLWATIDERARTRPRGSYTSRLLDDGVDAVARKVAEEATEVVMAAKDDDVAERSGSERPTEALAGELADLFYHSLVLCAERGLPPSAIIETLKTRHRA